MQKAGDVVSGALPIKAFSNSLVRDRQRQRIADRAFSDSVVDHYVRNGVFDYFHESANLKLTKAERDANIIGKPTGFQWEDYGGARMPVTFGAVTIDHPIVKQIELVRHMNAGNDVFGVSVGGQVLNKAEGDGEEVIDEIYWDHLAFAPRHKIICPGSRLMLQKAEDGSQFALASFDCLDRFCADLPHVPMDSEYLHKALTVGGGSLDVRDLTGVRALMPQELDEDVKRFHMLKKAGFLAGIDDVRYWFNGRAEAVIDAVHNQKFEGGRTHG